MYARFHRPGPGKWQIAGLCPDAEEIRRGRRPWWSVVLTVCWTFLSVSVGSVHAGRLNDPLVAGGEVESFLVSPDNQRVVYRADQSGDQTFELHSLPIAGGAVTTINGPLVPGGDVFDFLISPDSGRVVYQADQDTEDMVELYSVPVAGGAATKLNGLLVPAGHVLSGFLISADSGRVVYRAAQDTADTSELYSVPLAGGAATKLNGLLAADSDVLPGFLISADSTAQRLVCPALSVADADHPFLIALARK